MLDNNIDLATATVIASAQLLSRKKRKENPDIIRDESFRENGYQNWSNAMFKKKLYVR